MTRAQVLPIGVDIGWDSIKMLQLAVDGGTLAVRAAARRPLPEEARADAKSFLPLAADLIRQMLRQTEFVGRQVVAALPRDIVHVKNLRLPKIPPAELEAAVHFEAKNIFAFDTDQAHVRHLYAGEVRQGNETRQELIALAARHEDVNGFLEQVHRSGCVVESLDFEPCALYRSIERFIRRREDEHEVHVLVDVGYRCTQVIIGRGREISFFKPVEIGGRHFREMVSRKLEISDDEACELRRRMINETIAARANGVGGAGATAATAAAAVARGGRADPVRQAVCDATRSVMDELAREISLCLRYHSVTFRGHRPSKLRLIGGEACDPQLHAILSAALPIPVEAASPMYSVDTSRLPAADRNGRMGEWTVALGLALKQTREHFGARDGRQRDGAAPPLTMGAGASGGGVEVIDLARAINGEPATMPAGAAAAAAAVSTSNGAPSLARNAPRPAPATALTTPEEALRA